MIGMEAFLGDYKMCPQISRTHTGAGRPKGVRRSLCLGLIQFPVWMEVPFLLWVPVECFLCKVLWSLGVLDGDVEGSASARAFDWHVFIYLYAGSAASGAANGMEVTKGASLQWKKHQTVKSGINASGLGVAFWEEYFVSWENYCCRMKRMGDVFGQT